MLVLKFGGTSVQDAPAMDQALDITLPYLSQAPLLVSSAMAGVTNDLVALVDAVERQDGPAADALVEKLEVRHKTVLQEAAQGTFLEEGRPRLAALFADLRGPGQRVHPPQ